MDESPDACEDYEPRTIKISEGSAINILLMDLQWWVTYTATIKMLATTISCSTGDWSLGRTLIILI